MSYLELIPEVRSIYALISIITFVISVTDFVRNVSSFKNKSSAGIPAATALINLALYYIYGYSVETILEGPQHLRYSGFYDNILKMPAAAFGLLLFGTLAVASVSYHLTSMKINSSITLRSIREGFNSIDTGVLMYRDGGFILLANTIMQDISVSLTGKRVTNGESFEKVVSSPDNHIVLSDGSVYLIKKNSLTLEGKKVNELTAIDVTEQTRLRKEIRKLEEQKEEFNKRLSDYAKKVDEVTIKKEILDTKIDVHGALGNALLLSKSYLKNDKSAPDKESLKSMWHKAIIFKDTDITQKEDSFGKALYEAAKVCGITLTIDGKIPSPENAHIRKILSTATREAIINASRHAGADKVDIEILSEGNVTCLVFTNNGKTPDKVTEGGGLSSLRQLVEDQGGTMKVMAVPQFRIIIMAPEKKS